MKRKAGALLIILCLMLSACTRAEETAPNSVKVAPEPVSSGKTEVVSDENMISETAESKATEPIVLKVYSQLSSRSGLHDQGWFAKLMLDKYNVKLCYITEFDTEKEPEIEADLIVYGSSRTQYRKAAAKGLLLDWEAEGLLENHGTYILENMSHALEHNRRLILEENKIFGLGDSVVPHAEVSEDFFYTWDIRWDLYKELGYPQVADLEDFVLLLEDMKELCPVDEEGEETYAMSLWSEWDRYGDIPMVVGSLATAYYGYDDFHLGLYDTTSGTFHGALEEDGPYEEMLAFFNTLYRKGLLDPASKTQSYEEASEKTKAGGVLFSVFDYAGSSTYNTEDHMTENKYMAAMPPAEASPAAYGLSVYGGNRIWSIGANTPYPELCMEILNWFCTPEGRVTYAYGPKGVTWDYDEERNTYFTELGRQCFLALHTKIPEEYGGGTFGDGSPQFNNVTWSIHAPNPETNGESYDCESWKSNTPAAACAMEQDWRDYTKAVNATEYIKTGKHVIIPKVTYEAAPKETAFAQTWEQVRSCIMDGSWAAIYAESEEEFEKLLSEMRSKAAECGYAHCVTWCEFEAEKRKKLEQAVRE